MRLSVIVFVLSLFISSAQAFDKGQRVWIDLSAANINDDSYGEGEVIKNLGNGKIEVFVRSMTTSQAFSSGVFCASPSQQSGGWETPAVYNVINNQSSTFPQQQLLPWTEGYNRFFERQNWLHTFLKWNDHHPVIERSQLIEHQEIMRKRGYEDLAAVSALILSEYDAYQTANFHFYTVPERINKLLPVLSQIAQTLQQNQALAQAWYPKQRDLAQVNSQTYLLFMTQAIDKILADAQKTRRLLLTKDTSPDTVAFDKLMQRFVRTGT